MRPRLATTLNYAAYQVGWLAAVFGAAAGYGQEGGTLALLLTAGHVVLARQRAAELGLVAAATLTGAAVETWQIASGTYAALADWSPGGAPPLWLLALWAQFATTFRMSLWTIVRRPLVAAAFGAAGGPIAFLAGARIGAAVLGTPIDMTMLRLAAAWGLALAVLASLAGAVDRRAGPAGYRASFDAGAAAAASSRSSAAT